jgi:APA family basic amino acid/polyamine antiporter
MSETKHQAQGFIPTLGLTDAAMIVIGSMIGSGIFIVSADIVRQVGSPLLLLAVWALAGVMTLIAALSYGELSAMFPKAGGQYVYLREAFNPLVGFLYGWAFFAVIQTGTIAAVGVAFAKFTAYLIPAFGEKVFPITGLPVSAAQIVSIVLVVLLTAINARGVKEGRWIQTLFTSAKLLSLFGLIAAGFLLAGSSQTWSDNWQSVGLRSFEGVSGTWTTNSMGLLSALAVASVGAIFSMDAWNNITFIAGEVKNPQRNIGLSLFIGTLTVVVIYLMANLMYLYVLPLTGIATAPSDRVGVAAAQEIFGASGTVVIALMIMVSTFGCNNGLILAGARVYHAMAQDGLFFKQAGVLNSKSVPAWGLWVQCIWASVLCLSGKYGDLLDYVVFVVLIFYILTIVGIFRLRLTKPHLSRPYKAFGYPVLPALYIVMAGFVCVMLLQYKPQFTWPGLIIIAAGVPVYYWLVRKERVV